MTIIRTGRARYTNELGGTQIVITERFEDPLFELNGASFDITRSHDNTAYVAVMHPHGQDVEHDAAYLVQLEIYGPHLDYFDAGTKQARYEGLLIDAHYYPDGAPPKEEPCTNEQCVGEFAHPFVDYLPPRVKVSPKRVRIDIDMRHPGEELPHYKPTSQDEELKELSS